MSRQVTRESASSQLATRIPTTRQSDPSLGSDTKCAGVKTRWKWMRRRAGTLRFRPFYISNFACTRTGSSIRKRGDSPIGFATAANADFLVSARVDTLTM